MSYNIIREELANAELLPYSFFPLVHSGLRVKAMNPNRHSVLPSILFPYRNPGWGLPDIDILRQLAFGNGMRMERMVSLFNQSAGVYV